MSRNRSSTKMTILMALVRHGEYAQPADTPSAWLPQGLTQRGHEQARAAATMLCQLAHERGLEFHPVIDCSRLRRAWETAHGIAKGIQERTGTRLEVREHEALAERGVGALANLTLTQIEALVADDPRFEPLPPNWKSTSHFKLPVQGAESLMEAGERVRRHIDTAVEDVREGCLQIFVGHGAALRHGAHLMGLLSFEDIAKLSMHYAAPVVYQRRGSGWELVSGAWKVRTKTERTD
jgi:2,3-bisphosphoglycerate-dependent phosphoglycerate mutase